MTVFVLVFSIHILVCCFIAIGHLESHDYDINKNWIDRLGLAEGDEEVKNGIS